MADGTLVKIYGSRIHKSNAHQILDDAECCLRNIKMQLIALVSHSPSNVDNVVSDVDSMLGEYDIQSHRAMIAQAIIDNPDDCEDERLT